jgi:hypothetical protein
LAFGRFENGVQPAIRRNDDEDENEDEEEKQDEEDRGPQEQFPRIRYSEVGAASMRLRPTPASPVCVYAQAGRGRRYPVSPDTEGPLVVPSGKVL